MPCRRRDAIRLPILLLTVSAATLGQQTLPGNSASGLYQPPLQRAVPAVVADGVLLADGSLTNDGGSASQREWFVVDTAATTTIVDPSLARKLGGKGANGEQLREKTLRLAGAEVTRRPVSVFPLTVWSQQTGQAVSGVAGSDVFQHFDVRIDYGNQLLTLLVPQTCAVPAVEMAKRIPLHVLAGLPFLDAEIQTADGKMLRGRFLLDTGQSGPGLVLTSEFLAAHPEITGGKTPQEFPMLDAGGAVKSTGLVRVSTLQIGNQTLHGVIAMIAPPAANGAGGELAGVIGGGVLSRFDVLVDLPHGSLTLTPNMHYSAPFEADMSGMLVVATGMEGEQGERTGDWSYTIAGISKNSPAADAGLQAGDRLVEIANRKVSTMSLDLVRNVLKSGTGTKLLVTIDRSGRRTKVTLTLRRGI